MADDIVIVPEERPPWREAVKQFLAAGFKAGDVVPHEWFYQSLGIAMPDRMTQSGFICDQARLQVLAQFKPLQDHLLTHHNIDLVAIAGEGYRIVPPQEQTREAFDDGKKDLNRALRKMTMRLSCIDRSQLTNEQNRENADALAKLSALRSMSRKTKRLGISTDE